MEKKSTKKAAPSCKEIIEKIILQKMSKGFYLVSHLTDAKEDTENFCKLVNPSGAYLFCLFDESGRLTQYEKQFKDLKTLSLKEKAEACKIIIDKLGEIRPARDYSIKLLSGDFTIFEQLQIYAILSKSWNIERFLIKD